MKKIIVSVITGSLILIGCGSSSKSNGETAVNVSEAKTVKEAEKNLNALGSFTSIDLSVANLSDSKVLSSKLLSKLQKSKTVVCSDSGSITLDISDDGRKLIYLFDKCQHGLTYTNGKLTLIRSDDNSFEIDFDKLTVRDIGGTQYMDIKMKFSEENSISTISFDGVVNQTTTSGETNNMSMTNMVFKHQETSVESWTTIDGKMALESKCVTGVYDFKTVEKLIEARDGSENTESGILILNGATYTFENPHVTIEAGSESETMLQSELERRMELSNTCNI